MQNTLSFDINKEFEGKRVLVTGGTKGIGRSIVDRLLNAGAKIITTARTMPNDLPDSIGFIQANVSTPEGTERIIKETLERLGGLDILINNVGGSSSSTSGALSLSDDDCFKPLTKSFFICTLRSWFSTIHD